MAETYTLSTLPQPTRQAPLPPVEMLGPKTRAPLPQANLHIEEQTLVEGFPTSTDGSELPTLDRSVSAERRTLYCPPPSRIDITRPNGHGSTEVFDFFRKYITDSLKSFDQDAELNIEFIENTRFVLWFLSNKSFEKGIKDSMEDSLIRLSIFENFINWGIEGKDEVKLSWQKFISNLNELFMLISEKQQLKSDQVGTVIQQNAAKEKKPQAHTDGQTMPDSSNVAGYSGAHAERVRQQDDGREGHCGCFFLRRGNPSDKDHQRQ